jgi:hypothetical protein
MSTMAVDRAPADAIDATPPMASTPQDRALLELHVAEMRQLFNALDPAPFRERDLDPAAEAYIVDWGRETRGGEPLGLVVHLGREAATPQTAELLRSAVHGYFRQRALDTRRQLRRLFRSGRISLLIGLAFLGAAIVLGELIAGFVSRENYSSIIKESFVIGGWVALWRPMEIFLYDWWPIRAEANLYDRLGTMDVRVVGASGPAPAESARTGP